MTLKQRIEGVLEECFSCRTSMHEYRLEFSKATTSLLQVFRECLPEKKDLKDYIGSDLIEGTNYFEQSIGFNSAIKEIEGKINGN